MNTVQTIWNHPASLLLLKLLPGGILTVWCLWGVNWRKAWPVLASGGWAPLTLIALMFAFVWSRIWPSSALVLGVFTAPNLLWQLGAVGVLVGVVLFCGWLQCRMGWFPEELDLDPPAHGHDHHGHSDHSHDSPAHHAPAHH